MPRATATPTEVTIKVPAEVGKSVTIRHDGNDPETFDVTGGTITVPARLERVVLANVEGSSRPAGTGDRNPEE